MARRKVIDQDVVIKTPKAATPDAREAQLTAAAYNLAEQRILDGTASDTLIREFIKIGSPKEKVEREILERQRDLITAKTEAIKAQKRSDEMFAKALSVFKSYRGDSDDGEDIF